ncbi:MAG: CDGSH iron-sulfur domain-containing protein [Nitrososphaeraceae archaeon]|nr:CDGSH iron-sulfur domain-containing protein [Nitrososphaeraceae archaeon]MDW0146534.1 CDGSH iron-sulfur domain-containing protein [Nitrososphaeraceae archaeon]MDW0147717.1 CDGSH iron-sulfur domain-containing protein [Nitrososphaeraceae archaeon]
MKSNNNENADMKPKILPLPNGPYYLINDMQPKVVYNLQNFKGEPLSTTVGIALCRCGASKNKPFCDGTHNVIGFSSANRTLDENDDTKKTAIKDKRRNYPGKEITVHDNRKICSHAAECVNNLSSVFKLGSRPWINPDASKMNDIIDVVRRCPSGALSYSIDGVEYRDPEEQRNPIVTVLKNGPYHITGGIELIGENIQFGEGASKEHYTLCRCGASENKPFCDGAHKSSKFNAG